MPGGITHAGYLPGGHRLADVALLRLQPAGFEHVPQEKCRLLHPPLEHLLHEVSHNQGCFHDIAPYFSNPDVSLGR